MLYEIRLTVPPNTAKENSVSKDFFLPPGNIEQVSIEFAPGCCGLVHFIVKHDEAQIWPGGSDQDFIGDGILGQFPESIKLTEPSNRFIMIGWSEDNTYEHTIIIRIANVEQGVTLSELVSRIAAITSPPATVEELPNA